ncbi:MAG: formate dehydrogenase accessory protein FdhE [Duodenibacillus sp.]|nr:formate dehydrogenase accessory protein FdhE [Duodenibacillus sp.]
MPNATRNAAIAAYRALEDGFDWNALMDFTQANLAARDAVTAIAPAAADGIEADAAQGPWLAAHPVAVNAALLARAWQAYVGGLGAEGSPFDAGMVEALKEVDLSGMPDEIAALAGVSPAECIAKSLAFFGIAPGDADGALLASVLSQVIRGLLEPTAAVISAKVCADDEVVQASKTLTCPCCGSPAALSCVLMGAENQGNARRVYCDACGAVWPFERVRCALCGTTNSNKLKYVHGEGDPALRLHVCQECGGVMPTVFQEQLGRDIDYAVELDAIAPLARQYTEEAGK